MSGFSYRIFRAGHIVSSPWTAEELSAGIITIAAESVYAPSTAGLRQFVDEVSGVSFQEGEQKVLIVLSDSSNSICGFSQIRFFDDVADLDFILIAERMRGKGLGREMLLLVFKMLSGVSVNRILLEVGRRNIFALSLYRQLGFSQISLRKGYYSNGEDALVMEKSL
jgi:ribosomal-protein-alanine N-acetyltransferase